MRFKKLLSLTLMLLVLCAGKLCAQFETASIVGRVTDPTGAVLVGAKVTVTEVDTGISISRKTDKAGEYLVPALHEGVYSVVAQMQGFNNAVRKNVHLLIGTNQKIDLSMTVGSTETVSVEADQLALETQSSQKQLVVTQETIQEYPLMNMDYTDMLTLSTGVTQDAAGEDLGTSSTTREGSFNINGQRSTYNNYLLDGMDNNQHGTSNQGFSNQVIQPPWTSISQFSIVTTLPAAEFGRAAGGTISVAFKHGTNKYHGELYESIRNTIANANGYFKASSSAIGGASRTTMVFNQFGGNLGGPFLRNRFFFFVDYEGLREVRTVVNQSNIFKMSDHQLIASPNATAITTAVQNPYTGATYAADRPLPRSVLSPIALAILDAFPLPNNNGAGSTSISSNNSVLQRFINSVDKEDARIDAQWTPRMSTFARVSQSKEHDLDGPTTPPPLSGGNGYFRTINQQVALGLTRQIGAAQLLEARLGVSYTKGGKKPYTLDDPRTFGIQGIPTDPLVWGGLVTQSINGYSGIGRQATNPQWQYPFFLNPKVTYSWLVGKHNLKAGYEFTYMRQLVQDVNPIYGSMSYQTAFSGYAISDFLFGAPNEIDLTNFFIAHIRQGGHSAFVQDDWRVTPKLTLNVGMRYEYASHFYEKDGRLTNFEPTLTPYTGQLLRAKASGSAYDKQLVDPDLNDFMPRFGFAYSPNPRIVFRGGYGIGYLHYTRSGESDNLAVNGPQVNAAVYNQVPANPKASLLLVPTPTFFTLDNGFPPLMASPSNFNLYTSTVKWIPRGYRDPYVESYYFGFQSRVFGSRRLDIAYVGNHGVKLQEVGTYNQRSPELGVDPITGYFKRPYSNIGDVTTTFNGGMSNYNGLQVTFEQQRRHGLWFLNSFTWSRTFANVSDDLTAAHGFSGSPQDFYHLSKDYGPSQYDLPFLDVSALNWDLPVGRGKLLFRHSGHLLDELIGGWRVSLASRYRSGYSLTPSFTPSGSQELSNSGGVNYRPYIGKASIPTATNPASDPGGLPIGSSLINYARKRLHVKNHPEIAFCDSVYANPTQAAYAGCTIGFATTSNVQDNPPVNGLPVNSGAKPNPQNPDGSTNYNADWTGTANDPRGNVSDGFLRGDSFWQLDAGVYKSFALPWDHSHLEFRGQFYNVLNKTNFYTPGMTCCSTSFGRITGAYGPGRIGQLQALLRF